ncbi:hypothetical protein [Nannocystis pusilla]
MGGLDVGGQAGTDLKLARVPHVDGDRTEAVVARLDGVSMSSALEKIGT